MKLSPTLVQMQPSAADEFNKAYRFAFRGLSDGHPEADLHHALLRNLGRFITGSVAASASSAPSIRFRSASDAPAGNAGKVSTSRPRGASEPKTRVRRRS